MPSKSSGTEELATKCTHSVKRASTHEAGWLFIVARESLCVEKWSGQKGSA